MNVNINKPLPFIQPINLLKLHKNNATVKQENIKNGSKVFTNLLLYKKKKHIKLENVVTN